MKRIFIFSFLLFVFGITGAFGAQVVNVALNPYENVNWSSYNQYKANFHTHTTNSDGSQSPSTVIDEYHDAGYDILSITDHNYTTWPWPHNPAGMLAVRGNEYSFSNHMNAFYSFSNSFSTLENGIPHVESKGGLSHINHPGKYKGPTDWPWYIQWFRNYPSCVGIEVFNQGDRYPNDRKLWDNINQNLFSTDGKFAWGYSNDDKHTTSHLYGNWQYMLMLDLSESSLRTCQIEGAFYFCYEPGRSGNFSCPRILEITVDNKAKTISITATDYNSIEWIGPGTTVVATGPVFDYTAYINQPFVRAILDGSDGDSYTQPFGFETTTVTLPPVVAPILLLLQ